MSTVQRAFELARDGRYRTVEEIIRVLGREGHGGATFHLAGRQIRKQLRGLIKDAAAEPPG